MAVPITRQGWMQMFMQMRRPTGFLMRRFQTRPGSISKSEKVTIDIERYGETVAPVIKRFTGPNLNDFDLLTTKEFTPPSYDEAIPLDVAQLLNRMAGVDPYSAADVEYSAQLTSIMMKGFMLINHKIERALEIQASQILQTGQLNLVGTSGTVEYQLDFKPKAAHFPTVGTAWSNAATCTPLDDIRQVADLIRTNGKVNPNRLTMGETAFAEFKNSAQVQAELDNRRINTGVIDPSLDDSGVVLQGNMMIGNYYYDIYTYNEQYVDPATGNPAKYVLDNKVIIDSTATRFDRASSVVPLPFGVDPRVQAFLPGRLTSTQDAVDVTPNVYLTPNGRQITGELLCNPLLIPTQIDGFGCLDT